MALDKISRLDMTAKFGDKIMLIIAEHRNWEDIPNSEARLVDKIKNYKTYSKSVAFKSKYPGLKHEIILEAKFEPPKYIKEILRLEKVKLSVNTS